MLGEDAQQVRLLVEGMALERAEADVAEAQAGEHGRAGRARLVVALQGLAGLDQGEGAAGRHAEGLEHLGRQHLAHSALEGQAAVAEAGKGRLARALGPQIQQAVRVRFTQLRVEEAAAVPELGVVGAELMAVVAHGQGLIEIAGKRLKSREGRAPLLVVQRVEPDGRGGTVVAEADPGLREDGGPHRIGELWAKRRKEGIGAVGRGNRHALPYPAPRRHVSPWRES